MGGGVAALEALLALRSLAGDLVELELVSATPDFVYRPLAVAEPFGLGTAHRFDLSHIAREQAATLHVAGVDMVKPEEHRLITWDGRSFDYDLLLVAVGARPTTVVPGCVTIQGPAYTSRFRTVLRKLDKHGITRVDLRRAGGRLLAAAPLRARSAHRCARGGARAPQGPPSAGHPRVGAARALRAEGLRRGARAARATRHVELLTNRVPLEARRGELRHRPRAGARSRQRREPSGAGRAGALRDLPFDRDGFIPVDLHGRVQGVEDVYAAGDATTCPIKQGGVASQQADAAAEAIAARAGADLDPRPFRPVLRGLLLTGGVPRYLRAEVAGGRGDDWQVSEEALWWPPSKVAGRHLAPYLARHVKEMDSPAAGSAWRCPWMRPMPPAGRSWPPAAGPNPLRRRFARRIRAGCWRGAMR